MGQGAPTNEREHGTAPVLLEPWPTRLGVKAPDSEPGVPAFGRTHRVPRLDPFASPRRLFTFEAGSETRATLSAQKSRP